VKTLSLTQKRALAAVYLFALIVCASSYYLGWRLFGGADRKVLAVVTLAGALAAARYGPTLVEQIREYRRNQGGT
jgi:Flp pilus assembly protein protease CpaA